MIAMVAAWMLMSRRRRGVQNKEHHLSRQVPYNGQEGIGGSPKLTPDFHQFSRRHCSFYMHEIVSGLLQLVDVK